MGTRIRIRDGHRAGVGHRDGLAHVHNVGGTGAVGTTEFETGLQEDLPDKLDELFPPGDTYAHEQCWHDDTDSCLSSEEYF